MCVCERGECVCDWERMCECASVRVWLRENVCMCGYVKERESLRVWFLSRYIIVVVVVVVEKCKRKFRLLTLMVCVVVARSAWRICSLLLTLMKMRRWKFTQNHKKSTKIAQNWFLAKEKVFLVSNVVKSKSWKFEVFFVLKKSVAIFRTPLIRDEGCPTKVGLLESSMRSNKAWQGSPTTLRQERKECRNLR